MQGLPANGGPAEQSLQRKKRTVICKAVMQIPKSLHNPEFFNPLDGLIMIKRRIVDFRHGCGNTGKKQGQTSQ